MDRVTRFEIQKKESPDGGRVTCVLFRSEGHLRSDVQLHNAVKDLVRPGGASATFTSADRRMKGYVATPEAIAGVWADLTGGDRISRAVFYRILDDEPIVTEFEDVDWSYWDLIEQARIWSTEL